MGIGPSRIRSDERRTFDQFHHQRGGGAGPFEAVDGRDVGMVQRGERPGFALETREPFSIGSHRIKKDFDRDRAREIDVGRGVDLAHASDPNQRRDFVGTESATGRQRHEAILR